MEEINFNQNNLENISEKIADELMNGNYKIVDTLKNTDLRLFISFFLDNYPNLIAIKLLFALHKNITKFKKTDWLVVVNGFVDLNFNGHFN